MVARIGDREPKTLPRVEVKIRCVCDTCNNGWMSKLEGACKPLLGCLIRGLHVPLDHAQQSQVANWAIKTAMMQDAVRPKTMFYRKEECENFRRALATPERTLVWLGRYFGNALSLDGVDVRIDLSEEVTGVAKGTATTIVVGHVALQVLSFHVVPEHSHRAIDVTPRTKDWENFLFRILPSSSPFTWPPRREFTDSGPSSIVHLMNRWRIGKKKRHIV